MKSLYNKLAAEAALQESFGASIKEVATGSLMLQAILKKKLFAVLTEKAAFDLLSDTIEKNAEKLFPPSVFKSVKNIQDHVEELKKNRSFTEIMAEKKAKDIERITDLSSLDIPEVIETEENPNAEATVYVNTPEEAADTAEELMSEAQLKELGKQESFALNIVLNEHQLAAKEMALLGKSLVLIGAAGTGKTTTQREVAKALLQDKRVDFSTFKTYNELGERVYKSAPSIAFCAFTRRAAANLARAVWKDPVLAEELKYNIMTIHSLLEFEPETYEDYNEDGVLVQKFRFAPMRTEHNPLNITHLVIEEASMLDAMTLWKHLYAALPSGVQIIFIGDINQLPPVFGPSILNYALVQLPIVELKTVYRNQGVVLENAHNILKGQELIEDENFVIVRGKSPTQVGQEMLSATLGSMFNQWLDIKGNDGLPEYDPEDCIILSPFNVQPLGTDNMNKWIAQHLGQRRKAIVHEVIAGFNKLYLAVGDKVMCNKLDGIITDIYRNPNYHGKEPAIAGSDLTRFGARILGESGKDSLDDIALDYSNFSLEALEAEKAERKMQSSHTIVVALDNGKTEELSAAGDFGPQTFSLGYCLTVHKAQGSEWRKVFILLHKDQAVMLYRELFYTAVTRARTKVTIIAKDFVINKAIKAQRIKGNTVEDKIQYFNSGVMDTNPEPIYATK